MAGMLAARVLSRHFHRVIIVERDYYPEEAAARHGVPQAKHLHALLTRGHQIIEELFPGITGEWCKAGAEVLDAGRDFAWRTPAGWGVRFDSGIEFLAASRPLIDLAVQERLVRIGNIRVMNGSSVFGLVTDSQHDRVTGVRLRRPDGTLKVVESDLTVDAMGRMSPTPEWLKHLGCAPPEETVIDARLGYATRLFHRRRDHELDWRAAFIQAAPPEQPRAGIALPVEGDRWIVTLCGGGGDCPPTTEREYLQFARSLPSGEVYNLIRAAEPASQIVGYRRTENRWRHYECMNAQPEGFVVLGDAACAFNPVYGQGMTTAALGALVLDRWLQSSHRPVRRFQKQLTEVIATPWALATGEDLRYRGMEAQPTFSEALLQRYVGRVMRVSTYDPVVRRALLEVFTMVSQPPRLLHPKVLSRVLAGVFHKNPPQRLDIPAMEKETAQGTAA